VSLGDAGIASSSPSVRHWIEGDRVRHHLIDPRRGESASSDVASVTVVAGSAWLAEVMTKAIFMRGADRGMALADSYGLGALVVTRAGDVRVSASWDRHAVGA
jgi:thiamine biosynthesis lipoprotein